MTVQEDVDKDDGEGGDSHLMDSQIISARTTRGWGLETI